MAEPGTFYLCIGIGGLMGALQHAIGWSFRQASRQGVVLVLSAIPMGALFTVLIVAVSLVGGGNPLYGGGISLATFVVLWTAIEAALKMQRKVESDY